jgi:hypothetical protein
MPVVIEGQTYYRTAEAFRMIGISRNTLYRWLQKRTSTGVERRDIRGWRLFTREEIDRLKKTTNSLSRVNL